MLKSFGIIFFSFYFFGNILLPLGDFSILPDLPKMYAHCKATEDKDLTLIDFVTDHLVDFDYLFESIENEKDEKPHQPLQTQHSPQQQNFVFSIFEFLLAHENVVEKSISIFISKFFPTGFLATIFRPPIF